MEMCCISFNKPFRSILTITRIAHPRHICHQGNFGIIVRRGQTEVSTCMKIICKIHRSIGGPTSNNISSKRRMSSYFDNIHMCSMLTILFSLQHVKFSSHIEGSLQTKQAESTLFIFFLTASGQLGVPLVHVILYTTKTVTPPH